MNAGSELDRLIAERVMDWKRLSYKVAKPGNSYFNLRTELTSFWHSADLKEQEYAEDCNDFYSPEEVWSPSTDIRAAWQVVEKLAEKNIRILLNPTSEGYDVSFIKYDPTQEFTPWIGIGDSYTQAKTAPEAICLSALKVMGITYAKIS